MTNLFHFKITFRCISATLAAIIFKMFYLFLLEGERVKQTHKLFLKLKQKSVTVQKKKKEGLKLYPFQGIRQLGTLSKNDPCLLHKKEGWKRRMRIDFPSIEQKNNFSFTFSPYLVTTYLLTKGLFYFFQAITHTCHLWSQLNYHL